MKVSWSDHYEEYKEKVQKAIVETWSESEKAACIIYPYEKAICQGVLLVMPQIESEEISFDELKEMKSLRGEGKLGSSGK